MLRGVPFKSAARAHEYYTQALVKEDYWSKGAAVAGLWHGKAAQKLGLPDEVKAEDFEALAKNRYPEFHEKAGKKVTVRDRKGRVVGMDMSFGVPKSVSILYAFTGNQLITELVLLANQKMMEAIEQDAVTQGWIDGKNQDRVVGNLAYATFLHHTSRPVGGIPDPHLHTHNFIMNLCFDKKTKRFQAVKFRQMKQNAPYYEAIARSWLAYGLREIGFDVKKVGKSFEIVGIDRPLIQKYSRRTMQIERMIAEKGIKDAVAKAEIGARSREAKQASLSPQQTLAAWQAFRNEDEERMLARVVEMQGQVAESALTPQVAVDFALAHCFDKKSVVKTQDVFREAIAHCYGPILPDEIAAEIGRRNLITGKIRGVEYCTTQIVLGEESVMLEWVRQGKGRFARLALKPHKIQRDFLSAEQRKAVEEILYSHNQVIGLQGAAGVGKTTLMQEVVEGVEASGKQVFAFAPTAKAAGTLQDDGFYSATTLASLLASAKLQKKVQGQVIWVDEAGLVGVEEMVSLFRLAGANTRILLSGDFNQHSPVSRGDSFRVLQETGILRCSVVGAIIRQESGYYRDAAQAMADGDVEAAFGYLQAMDAFIEIEDRKQRYRVLAEQYSESLINGESPLLISPTHAESGRVTLAVRRQLHELKHLGSDRELTRLVNLQWSDAEKLKHEIYQEGLIVEFHQNAKNRIVRGSRFTVQGYDENGQVLIADVKGQSRILNLSEAKKYTVYREKGIDLARGDLIRMTKNGYFPDGRRFNNGQAYRISRIYPSGSLKLSNGALVKGGYGHIKHGYVSTSYSSQSQTVSGPVFIAQDSEVSGANSLNQFYVSLTRGKHKVCVLTDSIEELKTNVSSKENRISAHDFLFDYSNMPPIEDSHPEKTPQDLPEKQRDVIFNEKGEYRHTVGFAKHEVGGNFTDYVESRRRNFTGLSNQLAESRKEYLKGGGKGLWGEKIAEKKKDWNQSLGEKRKTPKHLLKVTGQKPQQANVLEKTEGQKKTWAKNLTNRRGQIIADARDSKVRGIKPTKVGNATDKKVEPKKKSPGKGMGIDRSKIKRAESKKPTPTKKASTRLDIADKVASKVRAKSRVKANEAELKGKSKGKSKGVEAPKSTPPVIIVKKK